MKPENSQAFFCGSEVEPIEKVEIGLIKKVEMEAVFKVEVSPQGHRGETPSYSFKEI